MLALTIAALAAGLVIGTLGTRLARRARRGRVSPLSQDALVGLILDTVDAAITVYDRTGKLLRANQWPSACRAIPRPSSPRRTSSAS